MPLVFTTDPFEGPETMLPDDVSVDSDDGSEGTEQGSNISASEFEGNVNTNMPARILFLELDHCRHVAPYRNDDKKLTRVCGNKFGSCTRNHVGAVRFGTGVYKTISGRNKFIDGVGGTCITDEEY
jgi:hypothetical protein